MLNRLSHPQLRPALPTLFFLFLACNTTDSSTTDSDATQSATQNETASDTTDSDTTASDTADSDTTASDTTASDTTASDTTDSDTTDSDTTDSDTADTSDGSNCGDGVRDPGEACDDGNDVDADGCNSDCTVSGSQLWTFDLPNLEHARIKVDSLDQLHVLGTLSGELDIVHFVFSSDGELLTPEPEYLYPFEVPEGATSPDRLLESFGLSLDLEPIYSFTDYYKMDGEFMGTHELRSEKPAWAQVWDSTGYLPFDVVEDGRIFGSRSAQGETYFNVFSAEGSVLVEGPGEYGHRGVAADTLGAAIATGSSVHYYTPDGDLNWSIDWPAVNLSGIRAVDQLSGGDTVVFGLVGEDLLEAGQVQIARYTPEGVEGPKWIWPDMPGDAFANFSFAVTPDDDIAFVAGLSGDLDSSYYLWKVDKDYNTRWRVELSDMPSFLMESDSTGALLYLSLDFQTVGKFAP